VIQFAYIKTFAVQNGIFLSLKRVSQDKFLGGTVGLENIDPLDSYWFKSSKIKLMSGSRFLFSNGILSQTVDVPPVKLFLEANSGTLDTFKHLVK
jgi:hypothetical protein